MPMPISFHLAYLSFYSWQLVIGLTGLFLYAAMVIWSRSVYIARANRVWTDAHVQALAWRHERARAPGEHACQDAQGTIEPLVHRCGKPEPSDQFRWQLTWNGAKEIGDWVRLHEAQRQIVWCWKPVSVMARLERAMGQLDELPPDRRAFWQTRWQELHAGYYWDKQLTADQEWWYKANLIELLAELYNARDTKYSQLASLYGKTAWLILAALLPLAALVALGYGVILLAGAIGGLISRLQRLVYAKGLPTSYGSSWVPLYLAPLLGALAAWGGLTLLALLQTLQVIDLRSLNLLAGFAGLPANHLLGTAVLLGLSERFLNRVGVQAEQVISGTSSGASPDTTAANKPKGPQPSWVASPNGQQTNQRIRPPTSQATSDI